MSRYSTLEYEKLWVERDFGRWLKWRRQKKGLSLEQVSLKFELPLFRLMELEDGVRIRDLSGPEIDSLSRSYGLDQRAIRSRACFGE